VLFDLDGVVTETRTYMPPLVPLRDESSRRKPQPKEVDTSQCTNDDYRHSWTGKPRYDGVTTSSIRGISLPRGRPTDMSDDVTGI